MTTTLQDIITLTRQRSNMENNFFVTDAELTTYINNSLAELDDILVTRYDDYRLANFLSVLPSDNSNNVIPISSTLYKLRGVDRQYNTAASNGSQINWYTLRSFMFPERNRFNNPYTVLGAPYMIQVTYRLVDQGILIEPAQQAGGTYQVWYTPKFITLALPTDILDLSMDTQAWVEYAVVDCCVKIFNKQNLDPSGFMAEKMALKERIVGAAQNRDTSGPQRIANTRMNNIYGYGGWNNGFGDFGSGF